MESTSSAIIPEKDWISIMCPCICSYYLLVGTLLLSQGLSLESITFYVENSTYTNALTEYNDVKSRKKIGGNIYDKKSYTDRRGQV